MACEQPRTAYQALSGGPISFSRPIHGQAGQDYLAYRIPCGICILCQEEKARQWAVRIHHEAHMNERNAFLTLTYNDENLPEHNSLRYEDLVLFWKRLRKRYGKLRYYACGEYGDQTQRPHYHACVFGLDFSDGRVIVRETPTILWTHPDLESIWGLGNVSVGALNFATARYTASYVTKKLREKQQYVRIDEETGELIPLEQPRGFMSRNIGRAWWDLYRHQVSAHDYVIIDGKRQKPPQAYDRWLGEKSEIAKEMIKQQRFNHAKEQTTEKTHARARSAHVRAKRKKKKL